MRITAPWLVAHGCAESGVPISRVEFGRIITRRRISRAWLGYPIRRGRTNCPKRGKKVIAHTICVPKRFCCSSPAIDKYLGAISSQLFINGWGYKLSGIII